VLACSAGGDGQKHRLGSRICDLAFGYLSAGHVSIFIWDVFTPWWISSFVPNLEAELGLALMFASMIPIYGRAIRKRFATWLAYSPTRPF
jgi:hypothetical protein